MPQILLFPDDQKSPNVTMSDHSSCFDDIWSTGQIIDTQDYDLSRLEFICEDLPSGFFPDYAVSDMGCPIFSQKLKELIEAYHVHNIALYPARVIERKGNTPRSGFYAANILGIIDCIDTQQSMFSGIVRNGEVKGISSFKKLVLKSCTTDYGPIYRARLFREMIIVQEPLLSALHNSKLEGFRLVSPDRWDGFVGEKELD